MSDGPCRILVVDDNQDYADSAAMLLRIEGHEVYTAYSPKDALSKTKDHQPHVVLMDVALPGKTGLDLGKEIRAYAPETRIVVVTGFTRADILRGSAECGFNGHLIKPVEPAVMNKVVDEQCKAAHHGDSSACECSN
jgi:CheY-like chemotaxis protein